MSEKKVLIVSYYWPPSGGSGVQRWLKFVKYLPQFGWKPYVFTPANPSFAIRDESLSKDVPTEAEIIRFPIWEPYEIFFKISALFGQKKSANPSELVKTGKRSFFENLSTWVRGNFFVPDPRIFWVKPSVKYLDKYLKDNNIKVVITTSPPHSLHLIGYELKQLDPTIQWIADFRDPWSRWGFLDNLMLSSRTRKKHEQLEKKILSHADIVTTITPFYVNQFSRLGNRNVELLSNGYDGDDFKNLQIARPSKFTIRHVGIVNEKCNPRPFMTAVRELMHANPAFKENVIVEFVGEVHPGFRIFVEEIPELMAVTKFTRTIPHRELIKLYGSSSLLLLVLTGYKDAEGYMPGKLYEYLATGLPVLGVGPVDGNAAGLISTTQVGAMYSDDNLEGIQRFLADHFNMWRDHRAPVPHSASAQYSRTEITRKLVSLLKTT